MHISTMGSVLIFGMGCCGSVLAQGTAVESEVLIRESVEQVQVPATVKTETRRSSTSTVESRSATSGEEMSRSEGIERTGTAVKAGSTNVEVGDTPESETEVDVEVEQDTD